MPSFAQWKSIYQISPIYLVGGIAGNTPSQMTAFLSIVNPKLYGTLLAGAVAGSIDPAQYDLDQAFGAFNVLPGGSLINQTVPKYPLADMSMAANAIVRDPVAISMIWDTPMRGIGAFATKLATMQALKLTLDTHNNLGGTYIILTPSFFYDNCVMTSLTDNSRATNSLPQNAWRFDFERPMVMDAYDVALSQNMLMRKLTGGLPTTGILSGAEVGGVNGEPVYIPGLGTLTTALPGANAGTVTGPGLSNPTLSVTHQTSPTIFTGPR